MRRIARAIGWLVQSVGAFLMFGTYIGTAALHLYTILIAYQVWGFFAATLALCLPLVAEVFCFIALWVKSGVFLNGYSFYVLLYLALLVIGLGLTAAGSWLGQIARDEKPAESL
jgi:hypothetical protein